jgi:hypothetical protein
VADERLIRELYAEQSADTRTDHVDEAVWERLACGELDAAEKAAVFDHATRCAVCARIHRALATLESDARAAGLDIPGSRPAAPSTTRTRTRLTWAIGGLAATAALAVAVLIPRPQPGPVEDPLRSGRDRAPVPLAPVGALTSPPAAFRWEGVPGAKAYRVELTNADGDVLWSSTPRAPTSADWDGTRVLPPGKYYWRVVAEAEPPLPEISSPFVSFQLAEP